MWFALLYIPVTVMLIRIVLITVGVLKGPVFRTSEKYGDREEYFQVLPQLLLWAGLWFIGSGALLTTVVRGTFLPTQSLGMVLLAAALFCTIFPALGLRYFRYPTWYFELQDNTTRLERRRIAYMWLRLSPRLRATLSSNQQAFREWADMIILSTIF